MDKLPNWHLTELLESYRRLGGLNDRSAHNIPSKRAIGQICEDLLQIIFPGFHDDDAILDGTLPQITAERLFSVVRRLRQLPARDARALPEKLRSQNDGHAPRRLHSHRQRSRRHRTDSTIEHVKTKPPSNRLNGTVEPRAQRRSRRPERRATWRSPAAHLTPEGRETARWRPKPPDLKRYRPT